MSELLEPGAEAPDFTLADQNGDELTLSDLRGQTVVLYFYPRADTPGCTHRPAGCATGPPTTTPRAPG